MGCDYYIQTELVVDYIDINGALSTTRTNRKLERCYLTNLPEEDSDDDEETQYNKWKEELKRLIEKNTYKKMLYENDKWIKTSYEKKYSKGLNIICPRMIKPLKIYKDYSAWERF